MAYLKSLCGHTKLSAVQNYLEQIQNKENIELAHYLENGKQGEKPHRAIFKTFVNVFPDDQKNWAEFFDKQRKNFGLDKKHGNKNGRTFYHFILSPDPEDKITVEELNQLAQEWTEYFFGYDGICGCCNAVIIGHDDNRNNIPHAHVVVNNINYNNGKRLQINNAKSRNLSTKLQEMCQDKGMHSLVFFKNEKGFIEPNSVITENKISNPATKKQLQIISEYAKINPSFKIQKDKMLSKIPTAEEANELISLIDLNALNGNKKIDYRPSSQSIYRPGGEKQAALAGKKLWKDDLRNQIDCAARLSYDFETFQLQLSSFGVFVEEKNGDYLFYHESQNITFESSAGERKAASKKVYGKKLGQFFTPAYVKSLQETTYYKRLLEQGNGISAPFKVLSVVNIPTDVLNTNNLSVQEFGEHLKGISNDDLLFALSHLEMRKISNSFELDREVAIAKKRERPDMDTLIRTQAVAKQAGFWQYKLPPEKYNEQKEQYKAHRAKRKNIDYKISKGMRLTKEEYNSLSPDQKNKLFHAQQQQQKRSAYSGSNNNHHSSSSSSLQSRGRAR